MKGIALLLGVAAFTATQPVAQVRPASTGGDSRIQAVQYAPDQVVELTGSPGYQITLQLSPDEQIQTVAVGDSAAWQVTANEAGNQLFVKAIQSSVATNMTVSTNVRDYVFDLVPLPQPTAEMAYVVRFLYPAEAAGTADDVPLPEMTGEYRLSGSRSVLPAGIADDGQYTYIEWPPEADLPSVFGVNARGQEMLVNGMMRDNIYVIDGVFPRLLFRIDRHVARAVRVPHREPR